MTHYWYTLYTTEHKQNSTDTAVHRSQRNARNNTLLARDCFNRELFGLHHQPKKPSLLRAYKGDLPFQS